MYMSWTAIAHRTATVPSSTVDTHAHVFTAALKLASGRRYVPRGEAPVASFLALLDAHGVDAGVLVQPSFLGTDNGHLLEALATAPDRLRGIAVVAPEVTDATLDACSASGVVGVRFNLIGDDPGKLRGREWRALARRVAARGWQIEIQAEGGDLVAALDALASADAPLVVDHFGRPDPSLGIADPGFRRLLAQGAEGRVWVKLSGAYRCGGVDVRPYVDALLAELGPARLLWGSDWPWTQFESGRTYPGCLAELARWCDEPTRQRIVAGARSLFRLPPSQAPRSDPP